ncbi:MAG: MJ0042-type zinc finger domain-containing protein [Thermogemmata sp.]|uniref:Zinc finger/thioredoxin putative domain-containing protein n=1 Tax=Thermogemmata fonticola TaxID=2755323 RepID=A0A7V8VE29_9BACT|nr:MJ0042-type zinc finger domain-containing protein [Thermogemmata fonticola]MBA2226165.1 hypothetical protein [Thermogemmata fonticola]MCX8140441.1 hypothetical protein [Gemmataceae bacterium]
MAGGIVTRCPHCQTALRVPENVAGKRIKCSKCQQVFAVPARGASAEASQGQASPRPAAPAASRPSAAARPASPAASTPATAPESAPRPKRPFDDDDEGVAQVGVVEEKDVPRCPHCAMELVPPDAIVCIHCGFNNRTRVKADTRKVYAPTFSEWAMHLAPGIIAVLVCIGLIVLNYITATNMRSWLEGTFLEMDEVDAAGRKRFYIAPGAFIFLIAFISLGIFVPCLRFALRRLFVEYRPPERLKLK